MKRFLDTALLVVGMLSCGTINTVFFKLMFQVDCPTLPSGYRLWDKPWFTNMEMFLAEASLLLVFYAGRRSRRPSARPDCYAPEPTKRGTSAYYFLVPACCDVLGTGLAAVAMMYIQAAVWQMMRGAVVVFSAIFAVFFLKRKLQAFHWIGVTVTVIGLSLVGYAAVVQQSPSGSHGDHVTLGVFLVLVAQVFAAFQCTFEEYLLTGHEVSAMQTVGMEGVWGCAVMAVIIPTMTLAPGADHGSYESLPDGMHMMRGSPFLQGITLGYMVSIGLYNYVGMQLCRKLSAVTRCLVDCLRTSVVWGIELGLYYGVSEKYGSPWTPHCWIQLFGFIFLFLGTLIYNGIVGMPCLSKTRHDMPQRVLQATWSPTLNRAAAWGKGSMFGPKSPPWSPSTSADSPLAWPFGRSPPVDSLRNPLLDSGSEDSLVLEEEEIDIDSIPQGGAQM